MAESILPYKIMALGPFAPVPGEKFKPDFVGLDLYSIDEALQATAPVLYLPVPVELCPEGALTLKFEKIKDFKPSSIIKNNSFLKSLSEEKKDTPGNIGAVDIAKIATEKPNAVDDILSIVASPEAVSDESSGQTPAGGKLDIIMKKVFENIEFKKTESAWRGVQKLVKQAQIKGFKKIGVSVCPVSYSSLDQVLNALELLPGDKTPNIILIDLDFDNTMPSIERLENIVVFADKMMIPVCVSIKPDFFRLDDFNQIDKLPYIKNYLDDISYTKFRKLKELSGASWLLVNCNTFAGREANNYEGQPLSISPVWATGTLCAMAVQETGWPMGFSRYNQYRIDNLPMFHPEERNTASTRALLSDERIIQLVEAGITPVVGARNKDFVFIPKEACLTGDPIKFQMFFNRIIESLIHIKDQSIPNLSPEQAIEKAISDIFIQTGHARPEDISVAGGNNDLQGQEIFRISFIPPATVIAGSNMVEFSFIW